MRIRLFLLAALILFLSSCAREQTFETHGVAFSYLSGDWEIEEEAQSYQQHFVGIRKIGLDPSGIFFITFFPKNEEDTVESLIEESVEFYRTSDMKYEYTPIVSTTFNGIPALTFSYTMTANGFLHHGSIHMLENDDWLIEIIKQEAEVDARKNKAGFALIESTFRFTD